MTIITHAKPFIDLKSPDGNAFVIIKTALSTAKQLGWTPEQIAELDADMKSADYEHVLSTFDKHFGHLIDLIR